VAELGANLAAKNRDGKTPLVVAREEGHDEVVKALKEASDQVGS